MKCPVCGAVYHPTNGSRETGKDEEVVSISSPTCRRCKADLSDLFHIHDHAIWYHRQALHLLSQKLYPEAATHNNQALVLDYSNADFHALAGKLSALQGEWKEAISSWQQALKIDPKNAVASNCLQMIELMTCN